MIAAGTRVLIVAVTDDSAELYNGRTGTVVRVNEEAAKNEERLAYYVRFTDEDTAQEVEDCFSRRELGHAWIPS